MYSNDFAEVFVTPVDGDDTVRLKASEGALQVGFDAFGWEDKFPAEELEEVNISSLVNVDIV